MYTGDYFRLVRHIALALLAWMLPMTATWLRPTPLPNRCIVPRNLRNSGPLMLGGLTLMPSIFLGVVAALLISPMTQAKEKSVANYGDPVCGSRVSLPSSSPDSAAFA
jgi:hypothetical protein